MPRLPPAAAAAALALLLVASPACVHACSSFVVNCPTDGAVVTVRTLDFSSDLTEYTSERVGMGTGVMGWDTAGARAGCDALHARAQHCALQSSACRPRA